MADADLIHGADELQRTGHLSDAIELYLQAARRAETPDADLCLKLARCYERSGEHDQAFHWAARVVDASDDFLPWASASALVSSMVKVPRPQSRRSARLAVTSSYTTAQLVGMIRLAALREGIDLTLYEGEYGQYRQDVIDPQSALYAFDPDYVLIAPHEGVLEFPQFSDSPEQDVAGELTRWVGLWTLITERSRARVIQHNFALRPEVPLGHLSVRLPESRYMMIQALNARLGEAAAEAVSIVDCDRLAASFGRAKWFDDRYWYFSKQAVALDALPVLARHTVATLAACLGLSRKCLVLDLDNTLWGGVIGEDGLAGVKLGGGTGGEAFVAFQEYVLKLKERGVILAVASKNNEADVLEVFERHPDMRIRLNDISIFLANWNDKPANLRQIAETLNIGLDALVLADDNPAERQLVRQVLPDVDVIALPSDPAYYVRTLSEYLRFETSWLTTEDLERTKQYRARSEVAKFQTSSRTLEDFYRSLEMRAMIAPFDELHLPRISQLIEKTNQFNLTTRRHGVAEIRGFMEDPDCVTLYLRLRDRFADHGLVSLLIACRDGDVLDIETWLMSCRVIGRTVEEALAAALCREAERLGCTKLRGTYIRSPKNELVHDLYLSLGFRLRTEAENSTAWEYDLSSQGPIRNEFIAEWGEQE